MNHEWHEWTRMAAVAGAAALLCGCSTARIGARPLANCNGPDGAMVTLRVGWQPCAAGTEQQDAKGAKESPPGTWVGRQMVAAADWSTEHPVWASLIAAGTAALASGAATDWWGLADNDGGGGGAKADIPASDREVEIDQSGKGNVAEVAVVQSMDGPRPNVAIAQSGEGNVARIRFDPPEE